MFEQGKPLKALHNKPVLVSTICKRYLSRFPMKYTIFNIQILKMYIPIKFNLEKK